MSYQPKTTGASEQGFTLVELAIVMVIIGILIGGILKGQELINNAKTSATVTQLKSIDAALNSFQDKYQAIPGDMPDANVRLPNCAVAPCNRNGNGNLQFGNVAGDAPTNAQEGTVAFAHLSAADLISGVNTAADPAVPTFGGLLPAVRAGGGMWFGSATATGTATGGQTLMGPNRNYVTLNGTPAAVTTTSGALTGNTAAQIDRKIDDGAPNVGMVRGVCGGGAAQAVTGAAIQYQEGDANTVCAMFMRVLN